MSAAPRLSVGLPVYNGEKYLAESLDALLGQSFGDFELIISDNASTDSTPDICRQFGSQDSRIRYTRQPANIGLARNHNFVFGQAAGELFKWASYDDLYARDLLQRCIAALQDNPCAVLAHSWTALVDDSGAVTKLLEYPLVSDSPRAPERFRSMLFANGGDDVYGIVRSDVLRRTALHGSYHHADRVITAEFALHGPFYEVPEWLYFRRDHADREERACPTLRTRCANMDPRRADRVRHPAVRLYGEYVLGYILAIRRAPLSPADRHECFRYLAQWMASRALPRGARVPRTQGAPAALPPDSTVRAAFPAQPVSVEALVAGQPRNPR
jgi:glycosyltransferase involved in cell wall biosynthesis